MRTLIVMRHAKSDWDDPSLSDHDRPLNKRGRRSAPLMSRHLLGQAVNADIILASSAVRVQETLSLMNGWIGQTDVITDKAIYLASVEELCSQVQCLNDDWQSAMIIGHNPGLCHFVGRLTGEYLDMPTAAVAVLTANIEQWAAALSVDQWDLLHYWKPRELEAQP